MFSVITDRKQWVEQTESLEFGIRNLNHSIAEELKKRKIGVEIRKNLSKGATSK